VAGPSGSGKSTLLACLAGLDEPTAAASTCSNQDQPSPERERSALRARHIGTLFQSGTCWSNLTVRRNLDAGPADRPAPAIAQPSRSVDALLDAGGPDPAAAAPGPASCPAGSGGAGLAVALANNPDVLVATSPPGNSTGQPRPSAAAVIRDQADQARPWSSRRTRRVAAMADESSSLGRAAADMTAPSGTLELARCTDLTRTYGSGAGAAARARGVSCTLRPGHAGRAHRPSGSGKSTSCTCWRAWTRPPAARSPGPGWAAAQKAAPAHRHGVPGPSLLPPLDVTENIALPLLLGRRPGNAVPGAGRGGAARRGPGRARRAAPEELSGGQAQRSGWPGRWPPGRAHPRRRADGQLDSAPRGAGGRAAAGRRHPAGAALVLSTHDLAIGTGSQIAGRCRRPHDRGRRGRRYPC